MKVDGDKLAKGLKEVIPFMPKKDESTLHSVLVESHDGKLELTATDGQRIAHIILTEIDFPEGVFILSGAGCKNFAERHHNGAQLEVVQDTKGPGSFKIGTVTLPMLHATYPDYQQVIPKVIDTTVITEINPWITAINKNSGKKTGAYTVGVAISEKGCRLYFQNNTGETTASEKIPIQVCDGPDVKMAFNAEYLHKALTHCKTKKQKTVTIQFGQVEVGNQKKTPVIFENEDHTYWHMLAPKEGFPYEMNLTTAELEALKWADEALAAVRKGEVKGKVLIGGGKFYLEVADLPDTQVLTREPVLVGADNDA